MSTILALGDSGPGPADESRRHGGRCRTAYERSKLDVRRCALQWRARGLPLVIAMPNSVVGANDHATFGYFSTMCRAGL